MEYQFTQEGANRPLAIFDMGNEALARWFNEELNGDKIKISKLLDICNQLQHESLTEYCCIGSELDLLMNKYEVEVNSHILAAPVPEELPEGTDIYDNESFSGCGLEDFKKVLLSWQEFVSS